MTFKDYFSGHAAQYAKARPRYPETLYAYLATLVVGRERAWDCGTGNGQAAIGLAAHFSEVVATDPSEKQIANALAHPRVHYRVAPAENSGLPAASVELVTVAQAVHWFQFEKFYAEVKRVSRPGAAIAVWTYDQAQVCPEVDKVVLEYTHDTLKNYWPPEIRLISEGYRTIPFPFAEVASPPFSLEVEWDLPALIGYLSSWSATQKLMEASGENPLATLRPALHAAWGEPSGKRRVRWPMHLRVGKVL